jgi:hypothetical protein
MYEYKYVNPPFVGINKHWLRSQPNHTIFSLRGGIILFWRPCGLSVWYTKIPKLAGGSWFFDQKTYFLECYLFEMTSVNSTSAENWGFQEYRYSTSVHWITKEFIVSSNKETLIFSLYKWIIHCGENSRIFWDAADQTLPVTEYSEIDNWI